jgi:hypothetical protein
LAVGDSKPHTVDSSAAYDASANWQDFYDRVAAKLATETTVNDDFNVSDRILTTWPKALQQKLYNALYTTGCRIYKL